MQGFETQCLATTPSRSELIDLLRQLAYDLAIRTISLMIVVQSFYDQSYGVQMI